MSRLRREDGSSMSWTYILQNSLTKRHYIGSTINLKRRLNEHNRGQTKSTRQQGIWKLIYKEKFALRMDAKPREKQIKSHKGGNAFKKLIAGLVQW